jgi:CheY-like chemotaxis protein
LIGVSKRILVVDDHPVNRRLIELLLARPEFEVVQAASGPEALSCLSASEFSMVLLDISMPEMSGEQVLAVLRRQHGDALPVVAYTAHALESQQSALLDAGFDAVLTKPIQRGALLELVRKLAK